MPLVPGNANPTMGKNLKEMIAANHPQKVAAAAALHNAGLLPRRPMNGIAPQHFDTGGGIGNIANGIPMANQLNTVPDVDISIVPQNMQNNAHSNAPKPPAAYNPNQQQQNPIMEALQMQKMFGASGNQNGNGGAPGFAEGGDISMSEMAPWWVRKEAQESYHPSGLFAGASGGRTDVLNRAVPAGGYVIPADVVSGLGEGNTLAGAAVIDRMFHSDPYGIKPPSGGGHSSAPRPPAAFKEKDSYAKGGASKKSVGKPTSIVAASGEYMLHPDDIIAKFGDLKKGHKILDKWVVYQRKKIADEMKKLPGPKQ